MKKTFYLFTLIFLLNGCVESVALLGGSIGGASSGKIAQSALKSTISYGVKKQTGKSPLGHALAYAEKLAATMPKDQVILVNLSGRGDKDINTVASISNISL